MSNQFDNEISAGSDIVEKEASIGSKESQLKAISLTYDLKTDSDLCPVHERNDSITSETPRVCRCAQLKLLKEKTIEKIRLSQESQRFQLKVPEETPNVENLAISSDEKMQSEVMHEDTPQTELSKSYSETDNVEFLQESAEFIVLPNFGKDKPIEIPARGNRRSTLEERYSEIYHNDTFGGPETFYAKKTTSADQISEVDPKSTQRRSSMEKAYAEIFPNDFLGGTEFKGTQPIDKCQNAQTTTMPDVNYLDGSRRSSLEETYAEIFRNDMFGGMELKTKHKSDDSSQKSSDAHGLVSDGRRRSTAHKRYTALFENDVFGVGMSESISAVSASISSQETGKSRLCKKTNCTDSCTSHQLLNQSGMKVAATCASCHSDVKEQKSDSTGYEADNENSSLIKTTESGLVAKNKESVKEPGSTRYCTCSKKYPELFKYELAK